MNSVKQPNSLYLGLGLFVIAGALAWAGDIWTTELCIAGWGRQADGLITEKRIIRGKSVSYRIDYTFPYVPGPTTAGPIAAAETVTSTEIVSRSTFDRAVEGSRVAVSYCPWSRSRHTVDRETQRRNILTALLMAFMSACGLGYSLFRARRETHLEQTEQKDAALHDRAWADPLANHAPGRRK